LFLFQVTMQNHGSYQDAHENFTPDITVEGASSYSLSAYLSLIKKTDEALEELISYFSQEEEPVMVVVLGFVYWCYDKNMGIYLGTNFCMAGLWNPMLKNVFMRRRPYFDHPQVQCLKPVHAGADIYDINIQWFSFPSGHSSNAATVYGSIARFSKKRSVAAAAVVITLLVGCSRFCL